MESKVLVVMGLKDMVKDDGDVIKMMMKSRQGCGSEGQRIRRKRDHNRNPENKGLGCSDGDNSWGCNKMGCRCRMEKKALWVEGACPLHHHQTDHRSLLKKEPLALSEVDRSVPAVSVGVVHIHWLVGHTSKTSEE